MKAEQLAKAKSLGFSDRQIANLTGQTEDQIRAERKRTGLLPSYLWQKLHLPRNR